MFYGVGSAISRSYVLRSTKGKKEEEEEEEEEEEGKTVFGNFSSAEQT